LRSLVIRFIDCEGPGIIEDLLRHKGYNVTYHDAYRPGLKLVPESHQIFDLIVLMGGPQSLTNPNEKSFFKPYLELVENTLALSSHKVLGVCLGSQILANVLGSEVKKGEKGQEFGFGTVKVVNPSHPVLQGIDITEIPVFHFHSDTYENPKGSELLLSSEMYSSQMFAYQNKAFGIQCHLELTQALFEAWRFRFPEVKKMFPSVNDKILNQINSIQSYGKIIFQNILNL